MEDKNKIFKELVEIEEKINELEQKKDDLIETVVEEVNYKYIGLKDLTKKIDEKLRIIRNTYPTSTKRIEEEYFLDFVKYEHEFLNGEIVGLTVDSQTIQFEVESAFCGETEVAYINIPKWFFTEDLDFARNELEDILSAIDEIIFEKEEDRKEKIEFYQKKQYEILKNKFEIDRKE